MELEVAEVKEGKEWHDSSDKIMIQNGDPNDEPTKRDVDDPIVDGNPAKKLKRSKRDIKTLELDSSETKTKPSPKKPKKKNDDFDDMAWICAECKEADCMIQPSAHEFIFCDGKCNRIFHYPCAGLSELPKSDEDWICKDCTNQQHQCAFCHEYGKDDEDVFLCRKPGCGLFFHESCLAMHDVEVTMVKKDNHTNGEVEVDTGDAGGSEAKSTPMFTCPAHFCWTCTQKDAREKEENESCKISNSKKKKRKKQSIFQCKTETRVFRCLYCPFSYHASCIPPTSRFHELAVLCPDHASTHKLPDLDPSTSMQSAVENNIDRKILKMAGSKKSRRKSGPSYNPFFPGLRGDRLENQEKFFLEYLAKNEESEFGRSTTNHLPFCLPCDVKGEVHAKPAAYTHIHSLRYDPNNRPKRITMGERCQCVGKCGDDCFNRMLLIECSGDGKSSNCNVGGDCGNRALGKRQFAKCKPKRERGKGWGLITVEAIPKGKLVLEYVGEVIEEAVMEKRMVDWNKEHPNDPNFYVMALTGGWYIDARQYANMSRFINHSCDPNCSLVSVNVKGYKRNGIYSKRDIAAGEFLSYDYQFDTKQGDRFLCRCGAKKCRGTMKGGLVTETKKPINWKDAKARYEQEKKFLEEMKKKQVTTQVGALIPASDQPNEFVFSGPPEKHKDTAIRNRIFLWRNTHRGADFVARNSRIDGPTFKQKEHDKSKKGQRDILSILREQNSNG